MNPALAQLLHNPLLWRGDRLARVERAVPSGFPDLDRELPGGGWPQDALTELLLDGEGIGELRLLLPVLKRMAEEWIALVAPPHLPYAPAFAVAGIDPKRVIVVATAEDRQRWWAAEQILRSRSAGALLLWPEALGAERLRRLQLAAQDGEAPAFVFAPTAHAAQPSPSPLRIRLSPAGTRLRVEMLKRRGGAMSAPLLLDVAAAGKAGTNHDHGTSFRGVQRAIGSLPNEAKGPMKKPPVRASFNRRYPVGGSRARVWNRALAHADEVRRVPGSDPRGSKGSAEADASLIVPGTQGPSDFM